MREGDLSEQLGLSRTPIRNALRKLAAEGFLEMKPFRGCTVPLLSFEDMRMVFNIRTILEGLAAEEAVVNISESQLEELKSLLVEENQAYLSSDPNLYFVINEKIHLTLIESSGNSYLVQYAKPVVLRSHLYVLFFDRFCVEKIPKAEYILHPESHSSKIAHSRLVRALEEGEPEIAGLIARKHIMDTFQSLWTYMSQSNFVFSDYH